MKIFQKHILRLIIISAAVLFLVACDQTTKNIAKTELKNQSKTEIGGIINLQYIENDGGMLSLGSNLPQEIKFLIFIPVVAFFLVILFVYLIKHKQLVFSKQFALLLILSGGLGNLFDRILNSGKVIDFIQLGLSGISTGVFNIADFYITLRFVILSLSIFKRQKAAIQE
jgi:signal peptidase II